MLTWEFFLAITTEKSKGMYIKVYHKRSRQLLQVFNDITIVEFCTANRESVSTFYFVVEGDKNFIEWSSFATQYAHLFAKKAEAAATISTEAELDDVISTVPKGRRNIPWILIVSLLIVSSVFAAYYFGVLFPEQTVSQDMQQSLVKKSMTKEIKKRDDRPDDTAFMVKMPTQKEVRKAWKKGGSPKITQLIPTVIKPVMDTLLPNLKHCFDIRSEAGDTGLHGTMNLKIKVSGDGVVRAVLLTDKKYQSTLFGDCVILSLKSKRFPSFQAKEQVFTYYFSL